MHFLITAIFVTKNWQNENKIMDRRLQNGSGIYYKQFSGFRHIQQRLIK